VNKPHVLVAVGDVIKMRSAIWRGQHGTQPLLMGLGQLSLHLF